MAYMNCPACHLAIRVEHRPSEECPRCRKRNDTRVPMFFSPLPYRLLTGPILGSPQRQP